MDLKNAVSSLSALAQDTRLEVFRLLVQAGADGIAAGDIARHTGSPPNTMSAHLKILSQAGLVSFRRDGRSIIYTADYGQMRALVAYLLEDCCGGRPEICAPLAEVASRACAA